MHLLILAALSLSSLRVAASVERSAPPPKWLMAPRDAAPPAQRHPSYFELRAARVERNTLKFQQGYTLPQMRERDKLSLYGPTPGSSTTSLAGVGLFSAMVVGTAHTPLPLRFAFDGDLHVGPAIFDGGGMGAGFGGRL